MKHILSLGVGVQSSTLALMAAKGEIEPMFDAAIFADTGAEPKRIYQYLDYLETLLPFPVYRVMHKDGLFADIMREQVLGEKKDRFVSVPFFTNSHNGGMTRRQCTREYKIQPIVKKVRELVGLQPRQRAKKGEILAVQSIGISLDEAVRMKDSQIAWLEHRYPLIEKRMRRADCLEWMESHGFQKPEKSSCTFCPYHDDFMWRDMKDNDPESWNQAVEVDRHLRSGKNNCARSEMRGELFLHRSRRPLEEVDLSTAEERGQLNLFNNECEGMCGV